LLKFRLLLFLLMMVLLVSVFAGEQQDWWDRSMGVWFLDTTVTTDNSTFADDCAITAGTVTADTVTYKLNGVSTFFNSGYITCADNPQFDNTNWTYDVWMHSTITAGRTLLGRGNGGDAGGWSIYVDPGTGKVNFNTGAGGGSDLDYFNVNLFKGAWVHLAFGLNCTPEDNVHHRWIWMNGTLVAHNTFSQACNFDNAFQITWGDKANGGRTDLDKTRFNGGAFFNFTWDDDDALYSFTTGDAGGINQPEEPADETPPVIITIADQSGNQLNITDDPTPTINVTTDEIAECNISIDNSTWFDFTLTDDTVHVGTSPKLTLGTGKNVYVRCEDPSENAAYGVIVYQILGGPCFYNEGTGAWNVDASLGCILNATDLVNNDLLINTSDAGPHPETTINADFERVGNFTIRGVINEEKINVVKQVGKFS